MDTAKKETPVEIHIPHATKTWREFFVELGTIVTGILIALALEQLVEVSREYERAVQARDNIRAEISANLGLMASRSAVETCISRRLDDMDNLIATAANGKPAQDAVWIGHPPIWPMRDSQYHAATQSGAASLLPVQEQASYAATYAFFDTYYPAEQAEQKAWADLRTLERHPAMSAIIDWQLRSAVQQARTERWTLETTNILARNLAADLDIKTGRVVTFKLQSVCIPLHTLRTEALKMIVQGRDGKVAYDEP
jgi:hypothetical protein